MLPCKVLPLWHVDQPPDMPASLPVAGEAVKSSPIIQSMLVVVDIQAFQHMRGIMDHQ